MKRFCLNVCFLLLFAGFSFNSSAQFNDSTPYYVNYNSNGFVNNTNEKKSYVLNNVLKFSLDKKKINLNISNSWIYGAQNRQKTNNDFSSVVDANFLRSKKGLYYWLLASYEKSLSLQINNRYQAGGGLGYVISDTRTFKLIVSDGILYERNELYDRSGYLTVRNSLRIKFRLAIKEKVVLEGTDFFQHSFQNPNDYIILSSTSLSVKLSKWLSISSTLTYNRMNLNSRENLLCNYGLVFERYF